MTTSTPSIPFAVMVFEATVLSLLSLPEINVMIAMPFAKLELIVLPSPAFRPPMRLFWAFVISMPLPCLEAHRRHSLLCQSN